MDGLSLSAICRACAGKLYADTDSASIEPVNACIDSRNARPGDLFFALPGENSDGHNYVNAAFEDGAVCAIVEHVSEDCKGPVIQVASVLDALQSLATYYRNELTGKVIGITGSVGKTTTKEMISSVLAQRLRISKTQGNLNNEIGVPLTILSASRADEAVVVEMGVSDFGEMTVLTKIARPDYMVYTVIGAAHLDNLVDLPGVFRAKTEGLRLMPDDGVVFYNGDDPLLQGIKCSQRTISYGKTPDCGIVATDIGKTPDGGTRFAVHAGERKINAACDSYGDHMIYASLAGAALGIEFGLTDEEIARGIQSFSNVGHRNRIVRTARYTIIDDCYNANPTSVNAALQSMANLKGEKVCILGDMLELGDNSEKYHEEIGAKAAEIGARCVLAVGAQADAICRGTGAIGISFASKDDLIRHMGEYLKPGDTILIKASRGLALDEVVGALETQ